MQNNKIQLSVNAVWMFLKIPFPLRFCCRLKYFKLDKEAPEEMVWKALILWFGSLPHLTFLVDKRSLFMAVKFLVFVNTYKSSKAYQAVSNSNFPSWKNGNFIQWLCVRRVHKWAKESLVLRDFGWWKKNDWIFINMERKYRYKKSLRLSKI